MSELSKLNFSKTGWGQKIVLFFHGFGQDHLVFSAFGEELKKTHTCYSFDLFYHGKSDWPEEKLTPQAWSTLLQRFLLSEKIEKFAVVGFSLGGRFCISTFMAFPEQVQQVILIAPDGIHRSPWYRLATSPFFNPVFKFLMKHPSAFDFLVRFFERTGMVSKTLIKFSKKELHNSENRKRVYYSWSNFKPLQVQTDHFSASLINHKKKCDLILGAKDSIIQPQNLLPLIPPDSVIKVHQLQAKHPHMIDASFPLIISLLKEG